MIGWTTGRRAVEAVGGGVAKRRGRVAVVAVAALGLAAPGAADASSVLRVEDGRATRVQDRLLPPRSRTALPTLSRATRARAVLSRRGPRPNARPTPRR